MNSLLQQSVKAPNSWLKHTCSSITAIRTHFNKDYLPGPYPKTPKERAAAAEKYGIPLAEYEPYDDDGFGAGDYPKLPLISLDSKDPFYPWDNPELKRNFNEPIHDKFDLIREDRYDVSYKFRRPLWFQWLQFIGVVGGTYALYKILDNVKMFQAVIPPQIPQEGKVHYTFEKC